MIVAAVLHGYPYNYLNGASLASRDLLTALADRGHEVNVYSMSQDEKYRVDNGVSLYRYDQKNLPKADIVYTHPDLGNYGVKVAMKNTAPLVGYVHNYQYSTITSIENHYGRYQRLYYNSEFTKKEVDFRGLVIRPPFKCTDYKVRVTGDKVTLINVLEAKGGTTFWRLALLMDYANFLGIKGYGTQLIREDVPNVEIRDTVDHSNIKSVFKDTKVLLMPSHAEGWGKVGVEAMCSGIPVISSGIGGIPEALGDAAKYININYLNDWKDELDKLLKDKEYYDECSRKCKEHVRKLEKEVQDDLNLFVEDMEHLCGHKS